MSRRAADALPPRQRDFLIAAARDSLPLMRARWDELVEKARLAVLGAGVTVAAIDRPAFRSAVQPMLDRHLRDAQIKRLYDMLRDSA
jgi:TRAP-type C4-dicarboxylate transport system substrate-binding protein